MTEEQAQPAAARTRASVSARPANPRQEAEANGAEEQEAPVETQHTPTLPQGQVSYYAEGANNTPVGTPITVAPDVVAQAAPAAAALVTPAATTLEIAAPAPLPRPGDENLQRGTPEGAALQAELTGVAPEMPEDPDSPEAKQKIEEDRQAEMAKQKEAAESIQQRQEASLQREQQRRAG